MRKIKITVLSLLLVLTATGAWAGVEPFFKADWGMSPDQVKALRSVPPKEEYFSRFAQLYELVYEQGFNDQPVLATYIFNSDEELIAVGVHDYYMRDMSSHVLWEFMDDMNDMITSALTQPVQYATSFATEGDRRYYENAWMSADTYAHMYVRIEPGQELADYHCYFKFYKNDGSFDGEFARIKAAADKSGGN